MGNTVFYKILFVVFLLIESNYSLDTKLFKDLNVFLRVMAIPLICISLFNRSHKSHELSRDNPIHVTIFYSFIVLIFFHVECTEVVPFLLNSVLQSLKALKKGALIKTISFTGISVGFE